MSERNPENSKSVKINHFIDQFKRNNGPDKKLDYNIALEYLNYCISNIINKFDRQEKVNSVCVIANIYGCLPPSNELAQLFNENFFAELIKIGSQKPASKLVNEILKILNAFFRRTFIETPDPQVYENCIEAIYNAMSQNLSLLETVNLKLKSNPDQNTEYLCLEFIGAYHKNIYKYSYSTVLPILQFARTLSNSVLVESKVIKAEKTNKKLYDDYCEFMSEMKDGYGSVAIMLLKTKIDRKNPTHLKLIEKILSYTRKYSIYKEGEDDNTMYAKLGISGNASNFISEVYSLSTAMNTKIFYSLYDDEFKKRFYEQSLLATTDNCFPISKMCSKVSAFLTADVFFPNHVRDQDSSFFEESYSNIGNYFLFYDHVYATCMLVTLDYWIKSKAGNTVSDNNSFDDSQIILNLLRAVLKHLNLEIGSNRPSAFKFAQILKSVSFEEAREIQYKQIFETRQRYWENNILPFDNRLELEVINFVKEERILQLITGNWFYLEDPRNQISGFIQPSNGSINSGSTGNSSSKANKKPKRLYACLAPNRQSILFKEFPTKTDSATMVLEKAESKQIQLSLIKDIQVTSLNDGVLSNNHSRLNHLFINIQTKNVFHKIAFLDKNNKELQIFYTDTSDLALVWADAIKLILGKSIENISDFTKQQISKLFDVRRAVQFISILDNEIIEDTFVFSKRKNNGHTKQWSSSNDGEVVNEEIDEELYDYRELIKVSEGFYFQD